MKRFLTTTALALTLGTSALAEAHGPIDWSAEMEPTMGQFYGSDLIGMRIYRAEKDYETGGEIARSATDQWDDIGEINDLIISQDGEVDAVILGIGGFLGIGERDVAIQMDAIRVLNETGDSGDRFLVVNATKEQLETVPEYDRSAAMTGAHDGNMKTEADMETDTAMGADTADANKPEAEISQENATAADMDTDTMANVPTLNRPAVEREGYAEVELVDARNFSVDDLQGARVYGINDENLGEISELLVEDGKLTRAVVDVGGFLGMGEKPVAVDFETLQILQSSNDGSLLIYLDATEESLEAQPEYEAS
ncbi:PRC-barrel domain containing protein [Pseudohalocynthiibacter aestuariivivens]|uniref:PRC-barrel domain-containing protein n=1 Tax=Roseovarius pelagicus TaxID=2980108 RepID=A0ABY6DEY9_9RHOB|nr:MULTISPECIES: PRC-barrel domain-containing protein [Rhodobacterales]QIE46811.1 PRC-barrel domain containing protein [Pseudohalocynthiibacter aestuariivivens]UXX84649.1 PRC-barrel domain-containing protein [Roseovarius pelagicus]